jgi:hypothetical protein
VEKQVAAAYAICFSREPSGDEVAAGRDFVSQGGTLAEYCQVLLGLNELVYVN